MAKSSSENPLSYSSSRLSKLSFGGGTSTEIDFTWFTTTLELIGQIPLFSNPDV